MKLDEIADHIAKHLRRFEKERPPADGRVTLYFKPSAWRGGSKVGVRYVAYHNESFLSRADAMAYLEWLNAGNVGRHYEWQRVTGKLP